MQVTKDVVESVEASIADTEFLKQMETIEFFCLKMIFFYMLKTVRRLIFNLFTAYN